MAVHRRAALSRGLAAACALCIWGLDPGGIFSPLPPLRGAGTEQRLVLHQPAAQTAMAAAATLGGQASCALPRGTKWCTANISGLPTFQMAVYSGNGSNGGDIVSQRICTEGAWEIHSMAPFGPPGHALDVGGNLGMYALALAAAGWNVTTFEPLPTNLACMRASLCQNPSLAKRIRLLSVGLGAKPDRCQFITDRGNVGDGNIRCGDDARKPVPDLYEARGSFDIVRLDDILAELGVNVVDFVKLDVEGFECQVLAGGKSLLAKYRPRLIQSEVWPQMQGCDPAEYLRSYVDAGYTVAREASCEFEHASPPAWIADYWMCRRSRGSQQPRRRLLRRLS